MDAWMREGLREEERKEEDKMEERRGGREAEKARRDERNFAQKSSLHTTQFVFLTTNLCPLEFNFNLNSILT